MATPNSDTRLIYIYDMGTYTYRFKWDYIGGPYPYHRLMRIQEGPDHYHEYQYNIPQWLYLIPS